MKKEIISKFKEHPKTKKAWWAMGLGLGTLLAMPILGIFASVIRPMIDSISVNSENTGASIGFGVGVVALIFSISAIVAGVSAFKKGERSWVLWIGFVPAMLVGAFWVFMIIGEFIFPH
ncbi:MAG: hypothetical protein CEN87_116 [Parcubacteria group bacterium Licking1014_1]|nr:MAG: hypothetical protein CEN87_116 [Parcubacteria group bacterium Licking1014_1]